MPFKKMITIAKNSFVVLCSLSLLSSVLLSGCVTEFDKPRNVSIDKDKALELHISLAEGYIQKKNRDSARHHIEKAFNLNKNSVAAIATLAALYDLEGEPVRAEESYKKALKLDKKYTKGRNSYGLFLYRQKRYEEALVEFELAAADLAFSGRAEVLVNVGRTSAKLGNQVRAESAFSHAAVLDPKLAPPYLELAEIYLLKKEYAEAKQSLDQYSALRQHSARSLLIGIRIERVFGNKDKEASYGLVLKNRFPYSKEYLEYKRTLNY